MNAVRPHGVREALSVNHTICRTGQLRAALGFVGPRPRSYARKRRPGEPSRAHQTVRHALPSCSTAAPLVSAVPAGPTEKVATLGHAWNGSPATGRVQGLFPWRRGVAAQLQGSSKLPLPERPGQEKLLVDYAFVSRGRLLALPWNILVGPSWPRLF